MRLFMSSLDQPVAAATPSFWSSIREALRGSHQDFTVGNLNRAIILLAIPMVLEMVLESLFAIPCLVFAPELLRLMGASPQIVQVGSDYARIALGGSGAILLLFLNNAIFRGAGDAAIAMRLLWVSNIINLVLDPCLI